MKLYQLVSAKDGARSAPFLTPSLEKLAEVCRPKVKEFPELGDDYILLLLEDADGEAVASRAPLIRVSTLLAIHPE